MNKKIELYDADMNYIKTFETTEECAEFFDKDTAYINHNLKYRDKIRKDGKWYKIRRIIKNELQEKYDKALELLVDYNMPCEIDDFQTTMSDWCEANCSNDGECFKKCWNKFIEWKLNKNEKY